MKAASILLFIIMFAVACGTSGNQLTPPIHEVSMRKVSYRGGVLDFSIPSHWKEEYDEKGGGLFYEDSPSSGALRLSVMTFATPELSSNFDVATEARNTAAKKGGEAFMLRDGEALVRYDSQDVEGGEPITLRFWQVYNRVNPSHVRIAVFSYTLPSARFAEEKYKQEMEMLDREIRDARFSKTIGTLQ
jgi:hypothetical protein